MQPPGAWTHWWALGPRVGLSVRAGRGSDKRVLRLLSGSQGVGSPFGRCWKVDLSTSLFLGAPPGL